MANPQLKGVTFRDYQREAIEKALHAGRGIIIAPTAAGKTIMELGVVSALYNRSILVLTHTIDLAKQFFDEAVRFGFNPQLVYGQTDKKNNKKFIISTVQSFENIEEQFEVVIVDEVHHVNTKSSIYGKVLSRLLAPIRLGFSASKVEGIEAKTFGKRDY
jgi:DNA or RNA helicases of superfamily II